jgi:ribosomal protein S18 acetylase RimI-like enzyme
VANFTLRLRAGGVGDVPAVAQLFEEQLGRTPIVSRLEYNFTRYPSVVACADDHLVGFLFTVRFSPDIYEIANLVVATRFRGQGIGSKMIQELEGYLSQDVVALVLGNSSLWSLAAGEKRSAAPFYERHGFRIIFATPDSVVMAKQLRSP